MRPALLTAIVAVSVLLCSCGNNHRDDSSVVIKVIPTVEAQQIPIPTPTPMTESTPTPEYIATPTSEPTAIPIPAPIPESTLVPALEPTPVATPEPAVPTQPEKTSQVCGSSGHFADVIYSSSPGNVVLTFDDSVYDIGRVHAILDILKEHQVRAMFFPLGTWADANPGIISRMRNEGHILGSHTATHPDLTMLSKEDIRREILGGVSDSGLIRPPYGAFDNCVREVAAELGYSIYMWNVDPRDWDNVSTQDIYNEVTSGVLYNHSRGIGSVVVMHLHGSATLEALPMIIKDLKEQGFTFNAP